MSAQQDRDVTASVRPPGRGRVRRAGDRPGSRRAEERGQAILRVEDLRVRFGGLQAVAGTTFAVKRGTITGLIGPNGAGKSTVVNSIAGQVRAATGSVVFEKRRSSAASG